MLSLNFLPCLNVTFSKSKSRYSFNDSLLDPNLAFRRNQIQGNARGSYLPFNKVSNFGQIHGNSSRVSSSKLGFSKFLGHPFGISSRPTSQVVKSVSGTPQESSPDGGVEVKLDKKLQLALIFGLWYFQNIVFNIYNKKVLNIFPFPWLLASFQLLCGSIWMFILWSTKIQSCPKISKSFIFALLGPALFHTIGHISACVSFSKVAVSFTHVIKSAEPVFSVIFSSFLGDTYPLTVWLSILPIVFGCSLAAITEVSFNFGGLWGAMISNVGFVLRNIYSKKSLQNFKEVNGLNLYGWISIISFIFQEIIRIEKREKKR